MNKIIIKQTAPLFIKNEEEEAELLQTPERHSEAFDYICVNGIKHPASQVILAAGDDIELIRLQEYLHSPWWHPQARQIVEERGFHEKSEITEKDFKQWLNHCLSVSALAYKSEREYGTDNMLLLSKGAKFSPPMDDKEFIACLENGETEKVKNYGRELHGKARLLFLQKGPVEAIFRYIKYFRLETDEEQCALISRGCDALTWEYAGTYVLGDKAMKLIKESGNLQLWYETVLKKYMWKPQFEQDFGCIRNWQKRLTASFNRKYHTTFVVR